MTGNMEEYEKKIREAIASPQNQGEMQDHDTVGTVGSPDCGDMLRMWLKFKEVDGKKLIDKASFQSFGCQTAIAVASMATEMLKGKSADEALEMKAEDLSQDLGPLPPMKIHCAQLVEGALKNALQSDSNDSLQVIDQHKNATTLNHDLQNRASQQIKIIPLEQ